ncbi:MAG TPA: hypothetical protein VF486_03490 [Actinomycetes bacterium]
MATRRRGSRWFAALVVAVLAGAVVGLALGTVRTYGRLRTERVRGTVTVAGCSFHHFAPRARSVYACSGAFTADAGDVRVPSVSFPHEGRLSPGARVVARVSGPGDDTATVDAVGGVLWWLASSAIAAALLVAYLMALRRARRGAPHRRRPAPPPAGSSGTSR